jgi:hypothetical protein
VSLVFGSFLCLVFERVEFLVHLSWNSACKLVTQYTQTLLSSIKQDERSLIKKKKVAAHSASFVAYRWLTKSPLMLPLAGVVRVIRWCFPCHELPLLAPAIWEHLQKFFLIYSLNHHLESFLLRGTIQRVIWEKIALYIFVSSNNFLYLVRTLESHSRSLSLASEKSRIKDVYFCYLEIQLKRLYEFFSPKSLFLWITKDIKSVWSCSGDDLLGSTAWELKEGAHMLHSLLEHKIIKT